MLTLLDVPRFILKNNNGGMLFMRNIVWMEVDDTVEVFTFTFCLMELRLVQINFMPHDVVLIVYTVALNRFCFM